MGGFIIATISRHQLSFQDLAHILDIDMLPPDSIFPFLYSRGV